MKKKYKCLSCGEIDDYEISGSWFYIASLICVVVFFIASLEYGVVVGLEISDTVSTGWKAIAAIATFSLLLWTIKAAKLWLPTDHEKLASTSPAQPS